MKTARTLVVAAMMIMSGSTFAQDRPIHEIYSMMVFNFIKYVQWPDHDKSGEFVIGVVGNNDVYTTLNTWYGGKAKGNKTYVVKKFASAAELTDCHLVYIVKSKSGEFEVISNNVNVKVQLFVTHINGLRKLDRCLYIIT